MTATRQKLLGQSDMTESDYYDYFYQTFYEPYSVNERSAVYEENKLLADMYLTNCATTFTGTENDICNYGKIGLELIKNHAIPATESANLVRLANTYKESYLFSIIGDLYRLQNNLAEAKKSYAQALSLSTDSAEQNILKSKISQINE